MPLLKASCDDCGKLELPGFKFTLFRTELPDGSLKQWYRYGCEVCKLVCVRECNEYLLGALERAGASEAPDITYPRREMQDPARANTIPLDQFASDFEADLAKHHHLAHIAQIEIDFLEGEL